jgi:hypothetical protein
MNNTLVCGATPSTFSPNPNCFFLRVATGTIGSATYGVAKAVNLVGVKVLADDGTGAKSYVLSGIEWVLEQALSNMLLPRVCNLSVGGFQSTALNRAVTALVTEGRVFTAVAAGNDNINACLSSPASAKEVVSVGATDRYDARSTFSNFGTCLDIFGEFISFLLSADIMALCLVRIRRHLTIVVCSPLPWHLSFVVFQHR